MSSCSGIIQLALKRLGSHKLTLLNEVYLIYTSLLFDSPHPNVGQSKTTVVSMQLIATTEIKKLRTRYFITVLL